MTTIERLEALVAEFRACDSSHNAPDMLWNGRLVTREVSALLPLLRAWAATRTTAMDDLDGDGMDAEEWLLQFQAMWVAEGEACERLLAALRGKDEP